MIYGLRWYAVFILWIGFSSWTALGSAVDPNTLDFTETSNLQVVTLRLSLDSEISAWRAEQGWHQMEILNTDLRKILWKKNEDLYKRGVRSLKDVEEAKYEFESSEALAKEYKIEAESTRTSADITELVIEQYLNPQIDNSEKIKAKLLRKRELRKASLQASLKRAHITLNAHITEFNRTRELVDKNIKPKEFLDLAKLKVDQTQIKIASIYKQLERFK